MGSAASVELTPDSELHRVAVQLTEKQRGSLRIEADHLRAIA